MLVNHKTFITFNNKCERYESQGTETCFVLEMYCFFKEKQE